MLIVTNITAVDAAFKSATPRPIIDVIRDIYPDATIDRDGRAHAPHDGYECPITGNVYRGGEYLPFEHDDNERQIYTGPNKRLPEAIDPSTGQRHSWDGTRGQNRAAWSELVAQSRAYDAARSTHVGEIGKMTNLSDLTIEHIAGYVGAFGTVWTYVMKDATGNVLVYKGSKRFERQVGKWQTEGYRKGEKVAMRCKIKAHAERNGVRQTILERPSLVA